MLANDFKRETARSLEELRKNPGLFYKFLSTMGNNHKYGYDAQVSIFKNCPNAIACTKYDNWKDSYNRQVKAGAKSIPILEYREGRDRVTRIFDVSQTFSLNNTANGPVRWEFDYNRDHAIIEKLVADYPTDKNELRTVANKYYEETRDNILRELESKDTEILDDFFVSCIYEALCARLDYKADNDNSEKIAIEKGLNLFDSVDFETVMHYISSSNKHLINYINAESRKIIKAEALTKEIKEEKENGTSILRRPDASERRRELRLFGRRFRSRRMRDSGRHRTSLRKENGKQNKTLEGTSRNHERSTSTNRENTLPSEHGRRRNTVSVPRRLREEQIDGRPAEESETDRSLPRDDGTENEKSLAERRVEEHRSTEVGRTISESANNTGRDDTSRIHLRLEHFNVTDRSNGLPIFHEDLKIRKLLRESSFLNEHRESLKQNINLNHKELAEFLSQTFTSESEKITLNENEIAGYKAYDNGLYFFKESDNEKISDIFYVWEIVASFFKTMDLLGELEENYAESKDPAFLFPPKFLDAVFTRGSGVSEGKYRIYEQFSKSLSKKENIEFLKDEYGWGGAYPVLTGSGINEQHDGKGIELSVGFSDDNAKILIPWKDVEKRLSELIKMDIYLDEEEKEYYPKWLTKKEAKRAEIEERKRQKELAKTQKESNDYRTIIGKEIIIDGRKFIIESVGAISGDVSLRDITFEGENGYPINRVEKLDHVLDILSKNTVKERKNLTYIYKYDVGNTVIINNTKCEIIDISDNEVSIADVSFPLIRNKLSLADFYASLAESADNDYLLTPQEEEDPEILHMKREIEAEEEMKKDLIAAAVDDSFILIPRMYLVLAELIECDCTVEVDGISYNVFEGKTDSDINRIKFFFQMGEYELFNLNEYRVNNEVEIDEESEKSIESVELQELAELKSNLDTFINDGMTDYSLILDKNTTTHIFRMLDIYDSLSDKPSWFNLDEINDIIEKISHAPKVSTIDEKAIIDIVTVGKIQLYKEDGTKSQLIEYEDVSLFKSYIENAFKNDEKIDITIVEGTKWTDELKGFLASLEKTPRSVSIENPSYEDSITELKMLIADCKEYLINGKLKQTLTLGEPSEQLLRIAELNNTLHLISEEELSFYNRELLLSDNSLKSGHIRCAIGRLDYYKNDNYVVSKEFDVARMMAAEIGIGRQGGYNVNAVLYTDADGEHLPTNIFAKLKEKVDISLLRNPYESEIDIFLKEYFEFEKNEKEQENINTNFVITDEILPSELKPGERLDNNINAIKVLKAAEYGGTIGEEEQKTLAKYVGWGGLSEVFDDSKTGQWDDARKYLKSTLSAKEYAAARESTLTAFYTPKDVIDGIYEGLRHLGFDGGNILEPSMGIGNFIGNVPEELKNSKFYGVELDDLSGNIGKYLYPEANIQIKGFEETNFSNNFFDVAIGNVPFADFKVSDKIYDKNNFLIHDYFFAKAIDKVRVGGVIAFITSSGTMDKKNAAIRHYIGARCDLLGAIRLPNDTFSKVAGTDVTSDIIFLKKKSVVLDNETSWYNLAEDSNGYVYNQYFVEHPEMVLGEIKEISGRFGNKLACVSDRRDLKESLFNAVKNLDGVYDKAEIVEEYKEFESIPATDNVKNFSYTIVNDNIYYRDNSLMYKADLKDKEIKRLKEYIPLSDALREVIRVQLETEDDGLITVAQAKLSKLYDDFVDKFGRLNDRANNLTLRKDSNYPLVSSLENYDQDNFLGKSDIFTKRTIKRAIAVDSVDSPADALILSITEKGKVDFDYMEELTSLNRETLIDKLRGQVFLDIKRVDSGYNDLPFSTAKNGEDFAFNYVPNDEYLSGNIRKKIEIIDDYEFHINHVIEHDEDIAEEMAYNLELLKFQKEKLKEVLPKEIEASEINVRIGATWIPSDDVEAFMFELLETPRYCQWNIDVNYCEYTGEWNIKNKNSDTSNPNAYMKYGTSRKNAYHIIENALNLRDTKVYDQIIDDEGNKKSVLNKKETLLANQKEDIIKEEFKNWIFKAPERRDRLVKLYNEKFNSIVNREYDGSNLNFVGINPAITLKEHQRNAIARTLFGGNTLLAHVVGAGKTFEMVASAMESKRLGMCNKSLFVVPNHLTEQFGREFMQLYPAADILVATKKDFQPANRKRFISKIATSSYDAIIIGHSQFEKIPMSKEFQIRNIEKQKADILRYIEEYKHSRNQRFTVKQLEKTKKQLDKQLEDLNNQERKDDVITFEELGVDRLYVDEAHYYKNLFIYTKMSNVAGISVATAQKSFDMFLKCQYMDELTGGKGIVFATGTPISNSMVELYTMQRYLQYSALEEHNLINFDAWAATFGETIASNEIAPEGNTYRIKTRFAKFFNIPELMTLFKDCADIKTADQLDLPLPEAEIINIKTKATRIQKALVKAIARRTKDIRDHKVSQDKDNMLLITSDGKHLALDQRLALKDMDIPDDPKSKVNTCINNVFNIWEETSEDRLTQMIFLDTSTPKEGKSDEFTLYDDIKNKLIDKGVPKEEIAYVHDAKTDKTKDLLFAKVRSGKIRILLGSTDKMGTGTNVQKKLVALHDLDVPWRPSDLEQRKGRIVRQGNDNEKVKIYRYITEDTFDTYLWQNISNKQRFQNQIMTSKSPVRVAEDVDEVSLDVANALAISTGNPLMKESLTLTTEVANLRLLEANYKSNMYQLEDKILKSYPAEIDRLSKDVENLAKDMSIIGTLNDDTKFLMKVGNKIYTERKDAGSELIEAAKHVHIGERKTVGSYRDLNIEIMYDTTLRMHKIILSGAGKYYANISDSPVGTIQSIDIAIAKLEKLKISKEQQLDTVKKNLANAKAEIEEPFEHEKELKDKVERLTIVNREIEMMEGKEDMSKLICLDLETTGFDKKNDEILQFSIVDGNGITLLNEYVKPVRHSEWPQAMAVNHITPEMLTDASTLEELMPRLEEIFKNAEVIVGYNSDSFDIPFIETQTGLDLSQHRKKDVMTMFDNYYGERRADGEIKWQKLTKCAEFFNYGDFKAHDSLYDTKATLYAYNVMKELPDTNITIGEMYEYGYKNNMLPISIESTEDILLNEPQTTVYVLNKDNTEAEITSLMDAERYADEGYMFGIDKENFVKRFRTMTPSVEADFDIEL